MGVVLGLLVGVMVFCIVIALLWPRQNEYCQHCQKEVPWLWWHEKSLGRIR